MRCLLSAVLLSFLSLPASTVACSAIGCDLNGLELQRTFVVAVMHAGKPLRGVSVRVTDNAGKELFSAVTAADGRVRLQGFVSGQYWLEAELLGVFAGTECFHIAAHKSTKAKKTVKYDWGDFAPATRQIAGRLIDNQPGQDGTPIWNLLHPIDVPISNAALKLQDPLSGAVYSTVSDFDGHFSFGGIPKGVYVLHIDAGTALGDREYQSTDLLIRLSDAAERETLLLARQNGGAGSCGDTSLALMNTPR
jgi:hypothetical protein